ncbi:hypothetical protein [Jiella mangrovi]|uniref:Antitoxin Xre/MbcA/ParS-like toxin-binding domain-containing protein n=1 Tax=Jiella mangrovi TaxID=2821407 RepID=A0ABS4BLU3_9HYPH|nr:hypothetical protein [Jiella mangrovi]MBP0617687.1 hypothetical protein [Jiella mangrovi]
MSNASLAPLPLDDLSDAFAPDARARAILRGRRMLREDLKSAGGTYDLGEVCELLGAISRQAVDKKVREGALLAVPGPGNRRRYPTVQFDGEGRLVKGLREVQAALPTDNPWMVLNFLVNPDARLGNRPPVALLRQGRIGEVVEAARRLGEQGA